MKAEYLKRLFVSGNFVKVVFDILFPVLSSKTIPFSFFFVAPFNLVNELFKVLYSSFNSADDSSTSKVKFFNLFKSSLHSTAKDVLNVHFGRGTLRSLHGALISITSSRIDGFSKFVTCSSLSSVDF